MQYEALVSIIDDDESVRIALGGLVRSLGYKVETFDSAGAFLDSDKVGQGCVVTDIQMPGITGIQLKQRLDAMEVTAPVIMMTARSEPELHARALESGAICLLRKPFPADTLIDCLEKAIGKPN